jgi:hypothetical protein
VTDASAIIRDALLLETDLTEWRATLPCNWTYNIRVTPQTDCKFKGTYDGEYHLYKDHWIARMWDHYRWTRILVHELILEHLPRLSLTHAEIYKQQEQSLTIISHLATTICASVWSQLKLPDPSIPGSYPQLTSVFMLLWHLRVAGSAVGVPQALHEWVLRILTSIGQEMGIRQTKMVIYRTTYQRQHWKSTLNLRFNDDM